MADGSTPANAVGSHGLARQRASAPGPTTPSGNLGGIIPTASTTASASTGSLLAERTRPPVAMGSTSTTSSSRTSRTCRPALERAWARKVSRR